MNYTSIIITLYSLHNLYNSMGKRYKDGLYMLVEEWFNKINNCD